MKKFWGIAAGLGEIIIQIIGIICVVLLEVLMLEVLILVVCFIGSFWGLCLGLPALAIIFYFTGNLTYSVYGAVITAIICTIATFIIFFKSGSGSSSYNSTDDQDDSNYKYHT